VLRYGYRWWWGHYFQQRGGVSGSAGFGYLTNLHGDALMDQRISELPAAARVLNSMEFAVNDGGVSRKVTGQDFANIRAMDYLGGAVLASPAHETEVVTLNYDGLATTRDFLWIFVRVASYGGTPDPSGDIASLRFNGDSGANYWTSHVHWIGGAWSEVNHASATLLRLADSNSRLSRNVFLTINNLATRGKTCNIKNQTGTANAAVIGGINIAGGEWVNLVDQITSVQLIDAGSNNMGTGSGFVVMGRNFS
jgi:hypothetical protein